VATVADNPKTEQNTAEQSANTVSLVIGASGGIGKALVHLLASAEPDVGDNPNKVIALSRTGYKDATWTDSVTAISLPEHNERSIEAFVKDLQAQGTRVKLVIVATGILHNESQGLRPEKRLEDISEEALATYFAVNSTLPALWMKYLVTVMVKENPSIVCISARVGSISDNKLGGWYGYRASKAALNMLVKTAAVEYTRRLKAPLLMCYHPGTVDTGLSAPFQKNVKAKKLFTPGFTANQLLIHLSTLRASRHSNHDESCHFIDWDGKVVTW
jgi:NAD(P)-dependent dehydrogenase (short-subunit alcohol dehydrogenase family)